MRELLLSVASPVLLSWIGFLILALGLLGEVGVYLLSPKWKTLHGGLVFTFAAVVLVGYLIGHIGDDEIIAKLTERAEKAEGRLADRVLTDAQLDSIAGKIKEFAGQQFDITTFWDLKEPLATANRIYLALQMGGWTYIKPDSQGFLLGVLAGVHVWVHPGAAEKTKRGAEALISEMIAEGMESVLRMPN